MLVLNPLGCPQASSSCLARSTSPFLFGVGYGSNFCEPGMTGGRRLVAMSPPMLPPYAAWYDVLSAAYSTALRQWMLSSGATSPLMAVYQSRALAGLSVSALSFWSARILPWAAACTPTPLTSKSRSPASSRWSMSSALVFSETSNLSGNALRNGSVRWSHWSLRTRVKLLPRVLSPNLYGPLDTTCFLYSLPVSLAAG